ncbi:MAG TPA: cache domain-containing protein [Spirochaetota bacterium]|nr:cache domain-containing protein [Spirochaetota bacterium]HPF05417.1 cache domain-containing protein [Spirochaetota bacterium]HPJ41700.1 cache domain-containing protein [Spirochaetota bacterium]HPR37432.1 cache domain-containing protein [Spirochaetota bacterium]HRX48274.1 cache domain-containing protein [Spirochaetota bacterium]
MKRKILTMATLSGIFFSLLYISYVISEKETISKIKLNLKILAMQGSTGIDNFFKTYLSDLTFLSNTEGIKNNNSEGHQLIDTFYSTHKEDITSVTRIDSTGRIIYSAPYNKNIIGVDISTQPHNRNMNTVFEPVISDIFIAAQGYRALALHVPVFKNNNYNGRLSILIKFDKVAETFLKNLKTGETGTSWIITARGIILYHSDRKLIDENADVFTNQIPSLKSVIHEMKSGTEGYAWYKDKKNNYFVYYYPVKLLSTHWSIAISESKKEILGATTELRNMWLILILLFLVLNMIYLVYIIKSQAKIKTQKVDILEVNKNLVNARQEIKSLNKLLPICSSCKKIRNDDGYWNSVESYINEHSNTELTHSLCPDCLKKYYPESDK